MTKFDSDRFGRTSMPYFQPDTHNTGLLWGVSLPRLELNWRKVRNFPLAKNARMTWHVIIPYPIRQDGVPRKIIKINSTETTEKWGAGKRK